LTSIALSPGNEHDGHHAGTLVDQQPEQRRPTRVIGDTAYGNIEVREELERRSISVLAPVHSTSPKDGAIPKDAFEIDLEADTVTCPRATRDRSTSPDGIGEATPAFGSPSSWNPTASPARCVSAAHPPAGGGSGSPAARTCPRPGFGR
jgi:Transposase DDE domain